MTSDDRRVDCEECMISCNILGIPARTTGDKAKEAYRDLVRVWHPDRFGGNERLRRKADDQLKEINRAYAHLSSHQVQKKPPHSVEEIFPVEDAIPVPSEFKAEDQFQTCHEGAVKAPDYGSSSFWRITKVLFRAVWLTSKVLLAIVLTTVIVAIFLLGLLMALWEYWQGEANRERNASDSTHLNDRLFSLLESLTWVPRTIWGGLMILITSVALGIAFSGESLAQSASSHRLGGALTVCLLSSVLLTWAFYKEWGLEFAKSSGQKDTNTMSWVMGLVVIVAFVGVLGWRAQTHNDVTRQMVTTRNRRATPEAVTPSDAAPVAPTATSPATDSGGPEEPTDVQSASSNQSPEVSLPANTAKILAQTDRPDDASLPPQSTTITVSNRERVTEANPSLPGPFAADTNTQTATDSYISSEANAGYETYKNARFGFTIDFPKSFVHTARPTNNGDGIVLSSRDGRALFIAIGGINSGRTMRKWYDAAVKNGRGKLGYRVLGGSWFVVTWADGQNLKYLKMFVGRDSENSFTFIYPADQKTMYEDVVTRMEKSFRPSHVDHPNSASCCYARGAH